MKKDEQRNVSLFYTKEELIINKYKRLESDKSPENKDVINNVCMEISMDDMSYKQLEAEYNGFKVILSFPDIADKEDEVHEEVKQTMINLLNEQMTQIA